MTAVPKPAARTPKAKKRPRARNVKRHTKEWTKAFLSDVRVRFVNSLPCVVDMPGSCNRRQNHHVKSRGAGGTYLDIVSLCEWHHSWLHKDGRQSFEEYYNIDLDKAAAETQEKWAAWLRESGSP